VLLDKRASIWRKVDVANVFADTEVYGSIPCAIVPISKLDQVVPYAYESTHVIWVPYWLELRKEDQIRYGRRLADAFGNVVPWTYVINGRRQFDLGIRQLAFYSKEME